MDLAMHLTHCDPQNAYEVNEAFADDQRIAETSSIFVKNEISQQIFNSWYEKTDTVGLLQQPVLSFQMVVLKTSPHLVFNGGFQLTRFHVIP